MRLAFFGASSYIAKDLINSFFKKTSNKLVLFVRDKDLFSLWLKSQNINDIFDVMSYEDFCIKDKFDVILNFVGSGDPVRTKEMGSKIFDITRQYDQLAINYLKYYNKCRYIFISSGAIYGNSFDSPVHEDSVSQININKIHSHDWYTLAKLQTELLHRSLIDLPIVDVRIFNYFSSSQDINSRAFISDILRSIQHKAVLETSDEYMVRDYIGPNDFFDLINAILNSTAINDAVDCFTKEPIDKPTLLNFMEAEFGLHYKNTKREVYLNATGKKPFYYSLNKHAKIFGYEPRFSSLENIAIEARKFFK